MPHLDGQQAFREILRISAEAPVLLCSGYNDQDASQRFVGKGLTGFIQKPYDIATLRGKLRQVVGDMDCKTPQD